MEVTDLDVIVPEPKTVRFGGKEYAVPADLPMDIFLRINLAGTYKNEDGSDDQLKQLDSLLASLTDLLLWEQPTLDADSRKVLHDEIDALLRHRGVRYCFSLVNAIYAEDDAKADAVADALPPASGAQAPPAEDLSGTKSSSTSPSLAIPGTASEVASSG